MSDTPMYITGPKCGKQIRVRMEGDTFFLAESCQNDCAEGTGVVALMESCKVCPADHPIQIVVRDKDGTESPAGATVAKQQVEPPAPEVAPAPPMLPKGSEINLPTPPPVQAAPQSLPEAPPVQAAPQATLPQMDIMAAFQAATQLAAAEPVTLVAEATPEIPVGLPPIREEESESGTVSEAQFLPMDLAPKMDPVDLAPAPAPGTDGNPLLIPAPREAQPALSSADLSIQGVQLVPVSPEDRVDVEAAIASVPGYKGGPSVGGLSSHDLLDFQQCHRRSFFNRRLGLGSVTEKRHFKVGSLYHACMAMRYGVQSDLTFAPCDAVAAAGAPEMARSVRALIEMQLRIYAQQEWETWCPLAVEECYVYHLPKQKINDVSGVQIPISWRPDLILGIKRAEDPHPVAGHRHDGPVFIVDWKSTGYITPDLTDGFAMDFQFKTYQSLYHRMGFEERYGRLAGVMVCIAEKQDGKSAPNPDSFFRQTAPTSKAELDEFFEDELMPLATEYYSLLQDQDKTLNHRAWSRSTSNCITRWGKCDYHVICNGGRIDDRIHFKVNPHRIIDISTFAGAPSGKAVTEAAASAKAKADPDAELKKQAKKDIKEELKVKCTELYASWLLSWMEIQPEVYASILKENFITPDAKFDGVVKALTDALQSLYSAFARDKVVNPIGDYTWSYRPSSIGVCPTGQKLKATVTYKQLATAICKMDWFNMSKVMAG